ncbi:MAG TPA: hypothetical protein VK533_09990 [Sphingomonas sp.]|uniref:hypothetical protein n=1 Tax=Sphingomonas sp. TaxID=28214 RepID=UPI002BBE140E|nr:hypothetical protein [Sphingomonas sp.]HMI19864.1 hypothetical protein [Sphingomonas sp.]
MLTLLLGLGIATASPYTGNALMTRIERSFSSIPFGTHFPLRHLKVTDPACRQWGDCEYIDANNVVHAADEENRLAVKAIEVKDIGDGPIGALGIGRLRRQADVVRQVNAFLRGPKLHCDSVADADGITCEALIGVGWVDLHFGRDRRLTGLHVDAYHFT